MNIKPVFTEKSLKLAKEGKYTFLVELSANKNAIKSAVAKLFEVHVKRISTITIPGERKKNTQGKKIKILPSKKTIITLKNGEKIDIFEESKK